MSIEFAIRLIGAVVAGMVGWQFGLIVSGTSSDNYPYVFTIAAATFGMGLLLTPYLTTRPFAWARVRVTNMPAHDVVAGAIGMVVGLLTAALLSLPLSLLPSYLGRFLPVVASLVLGYFGMKSPQQKTLAIVGMVLSGIGLLLACLNAVAGVFLGPQIQDIFNSINQGLQ